MGPASCHEQLDQALRELAESGSSRVSTMAAASSTTFRFCSCEHRVRYVQAASVLQVQTLHDDPEGLADHRPALHPRLVLLDELQQLVDPRVVFVGHAIFLACTADA